jgi:DNA-binding GntR family transcriptional regulator
MAVDDGAEQDTFAQGAERSGATVTEVHGELRQAIVSGELQSGSPISSVQLARRYGVSRTPLREALRMLQDEGLVTTERNQRPRVATFSTEELEAVFVQRILLSAFCTMVTVPLLGEADLREMGRHLEALTRAEETGDHDAWLVADGQFHLAHTMHAPAAIRADLTRLTERAQMFRQMWLGQRRSVMGLSMDDHPAMYRACMAGDAATAAGIAGHHLATVAISLLARTDPAHEPTGVRAALSLARANSN